MEKPEFDFEIRAKSGSIHIQDEAGTNERLALLIGEKVTVWTGLSIRNSFESQISVCGYLEKHPESNDYRIVLSDGTYTYFQPINVYMISVKKAGFQDGSKAVVELKFGVY